tara:strand:- start:6 stop:239 length:234 start_codon:yes stop_codon:yes gene_type:complete
VLFPCTEVFDFNGHIEVKIGWNQFTDFNNGVSLLPGRQRKAWRSALELPGLTDRPTRDLERVTSGSQLDVNLPFGLG